MTRRARRWLVALAAVFVGLPLLVWLALLIFLPTDEALARRAETELEKALGVPVVIGSLQWRILPTPALTVDNVSTKQNLPLIIRQLTVYPDTSLLWQRRLRIARAELEGAVVPQMSLRELGKNTAQDQSAGTAPGGFTLDDIPLAEFVFHDVTWVSRRGIPVVYEGEAVFDPLWRPRSAGLRRPGFTPATGLRLTRIGQEDRWTTEIDIGGGTGNGEVQLTAKDKDKGKLHLQGKLQPRNIEVSSALAAFNRRSAVSGKASGVTTLSADGETVGELTQSLHTTTPFTMGPSKILRFDLDKAIRTLGKEHNGQTPLDSITGQLDTQNSPDGLVATYTDIKATSGALSATGKATLANRRINAEFAVDLVDGIVGVPLKVTGPVTDVSFSVPPAAIAGAVVGTAVLPGIGTAIGARIGATLGKIFGSDKPAPTPAKPAPGPLKKAK